MNAPYEPTEFAAVPPHSRDAEQAVLGGLLLDNDAVDRLGQIETSDFYDHANGVIFGHIRVLIAQQKPADVVTVFDAAMAAGSSITLAYLNDLTRNTPSAANIARYAEIVHDKALQRGMLQAAARVPEIVQSALPTTQKIDSVQAEFAKLAQTTTRREPVHIREALSRYIDVLDARYHGEAENPAIPTGLTDIDEILCGGIRRGALATLGARPGMGKSALGQTIALHAALSDRSALFLSMEMPESEVTERAIANVGMISGSVLAKAGKEMEQGNGWSRVTYAVQKLESAPFFVDDEPGLSLLQVVTKARSIKRKEDLDLLVVDYLQLMTGTEEKRYQQIETITKGLKTLAKTLNIAILALSQLNREIEKRANKRPILSDFRDGGTIEQDSDIVMGLYREEQDNPDTPNKGYAELHVLKNRQGRPGRVSLTYLGEQMRFENFTGDIPVPCSIKPRHQGFKD